MQPSSGLQLVSRPYFDAVWLLAIGNVLVTTIDQVLIVTRILQPPFLLRKGALGESGNFQAALSAKDKTRFHSSTGPLGARSDEYP
jgi:hypothetical protein